ncbi:MAG: DNA primase [Prevotella sp.]
MIDRPTVQRILDAADIVDVVSEFVTLKKSGANYKGLCPFHNDSTPSFSVSPARNYCHCFSCGKGGSPVGFIMEHEQMTYPEALRWLAKRYHIEIKERELSDEEREHASERESLFIVNEWAAQYYHDILISDPTGRTIGMQYFRSRGFRDDIIERFRLGFALDDRRALPTEAVRKGYRPEYLLKTGLCYKRDSEAVLTKDNARDMLADRFAGRAIFPWIGLNGKVVAFGGRKLDKATKGVQQKYVNSPDSDIYHKDHELFGIYQARKAIGREDCVYMVEGYTDVISMHQCGIENVVANSGTALSEHQIHILHRLTKNIVLLYDGDAAGIKAAMRGTDMLLANGMNVKVLLLPDGEDPDSFARRHSSEEYREYISSHQTDFIQFKISTLLTGVTDPAQRSAHIESIVRSVSVIPDLITRQAYLQDCATRLSMPESVLTARMNTLISEQRAAERRSAAAASQAAERRAATDNAQTGEAADAPNTEPAHNGPAHNEPRTSGQTPIYTPAGGTQRGVRSGRVTPSAILAELIVRYGERIIKHDVETVDGDKVSLSLAEYVFYNLRCDNITLDNPLYMSILEEAVSHVHDEGFTSQTYFVHHPDLEISRLAVSLSQERYVLANSLTREMTDEALLQRVEHLLFELHRDVVDMRLKEVERSLAAAFGSPDEQDVMKQYAELKQIRAKIARRLGNTIG